MRVEVPIYIDGQHALYGRVVRDQLVLNKAAQIVVRPGAWRVVPALIDAHGGTCGWIGLVPALGRGCSVPFTRPGHGHHPTFAAPAVGREVRLPKRVVVAQGQPHVTPALVVRPGVRHAVVVHIAPERPALDQVRVQQLGPAPCSVGGHQVGLVDHPRAPGLARLAALTSPTGPAMLGHDLCKAFAKLRDTATLHGLIHRLAQVVQQIGLGRARHHEGSVVRCALDVAPGFAGQVELLAKEVDLLLKLLARAVDRRAGSASDLSHGPPPAPPGHAPAGAPARKPAPSTQ